MAQLRNTYLDPGPNLLSALLANTQVPVAYLDGQKNKTQGEEGAASLRWVYVTAVVGAAAVGAGAVVAAINSRRVS